MLGPRKELDIIVRKYEPYVNCNIHPSKPPPSEVACQKMLSRTPASRRDRPFRTEESPRQVNDIKLPVVYTCECSSSRFRRFCAKIIRDADERVLDIDDPTSCYIAVDMTPSRFATNANWLRIWEAGVAVNTLCIQHGFSGTAYHLGRCLSLV